MAGDGVQYFRDEFALSPSLVLSVFYLPHYFILVFACVAEPPTSDIVPSVIPERSLSCQDHLRILIRVKIKKSHGLWKQRFCLKGSTEKQGRNKKRWRERASESGRGAAKDLSSLPSALFFAPLTFFTAHRFAPSPSAWISTLNSPPTFPFSFHLSTAHS